MVPRPHFPSSCKWAQNSSLHKNHEPISSPDMMVKLTERNILSSLQEECLNKEIITDKQFDSCAQFSTQLLALRLLQHQEHSRRHRTDTGFWQYLSSGIETGKSGLKKLQKSNEIASVAKLDWLIIDRMEFERCADKTVVTVMPQAFQVPYRGFLIKKITTCD